MRRILAIGLVIFMTAAACGGNGGDEGNGQSDTTQPSGDDGGGSPPATAGSPPETSGDDNGSEGSGPSTATVTIGDETYEFSTEGAAVAQCLTDLFGIFSVQLPMADGGDGGLSLVILHEDTDPAEVGEVNAIEVTIGDVDWKADPEDVNIADNPDVPEGQSEVLTAEIDGRTVRGTANFAGSQTVFSADFVEFASGTFEATCGEERTS